MLIVFLVLLVIAPNLIDSRNRILNGLSSDPGKFPYTVSIKNLTRHICGGAIFNKRTIITAAHCLDDVDVKYLTVMSGSLSLDDPKSQTIKVSHFIKHREYERPYFSNDIALIFLSDDLNFSPNIRSIRLPDDGQCEIGTLCKVSGWGIQETSGPISNLLRFIEITIAHSSKCKPLRSFNPDTMICAGSNQGDACNHDSGGPLACGEVLCGLVSFGEAKCQLPSKEGAYSRVETFKKWIEKTSDENYLKNGIPSKRTSFLSFFIGHAVVMINKYNL